MFYAYRSIALYVKEHSSTETEGAAPKAIFDILIHFDILIQNAYVDKVFIEATPPPSLSPLRVNRVFIAEIRQVMRQNI